MAETPFHSTATGRIFFEHTMPSLVKELGRLNTNIERHLSLQVTVNDDSMAKTASFVEAKIAGFLESQIGQGLSLYDVAKTIRAGNYK